MSTRPDTLFPYTTLSRSAHHRRLGHRLVQHQRAFDLRRAHVVARHVDDVIDAAGDPIIAVLVPPRPVAGGVFAGKGGEIGLRSEEHTSELQSLMRTSYAGLCLKK